MATVKGEPMMGGFVLSFLRLDPSLSDRRGGCGFVGIGVVEGVCLWRSASVVEIGVCGQG